MRFKNFNDFKEELIQSQDSFCNICVFENHFISAYIDYDTEFESTLRFYIPYLENIHDCFFSKSIILEKFDINEIEKLYNETCKEFEITIKKLSEHMLTSFYFDAKNLRI